jgi:mycothiol system anti-sigma-R factor
MDCSKVKDFLYQFIDRQADEETVAHIEQHLKECPLCEMVVDKEKKLDCLIRQHFPRDQVPYHLKEEIMSKIRTVKKPQNKKVFAFAGVGVLAAALISFVYFNTTTSIFNKAAFEHNAFMRGDVTLEISSVDSGALNSWLQSQLDFNLAVPDFYDKGTVLKGARICDLDAKTTACFVFSKGKSTVSAFMFLADDVDLAKAKKVFLDDKTYYFQRVKGYNSILWIDKDIACMLVSDLGETELLHLASL